MAEHQAVDEIRRSYSMLGVPPTRQRYLRLARIKDAPCATIDEPAPVTSTRRRLAIV